MQKRRIRSRGRLDARIDSARHERSRRCRTRARTRTCTRATSRKRGSPLRKTEPSMLGVCACSARFFSRMQRARCITLHCVWTRRSRTRTCNRAARKAAHSERRGGAAEHQQLVVLALHDATAASLLQRCSAAPQATRSARVRPLLGLLEHLTKFQVCAFSTLIMNQQRHFGYEGGNSNRRARGMALASAALAGSRQRGLDRARAPLRQLTSPPEKMDVPFASRRLV